MNLQLPSKLHFDFSGSFSGISISGSNFLWLFKLQFSWRCLMLKPLSIFFFFNIHMRDGSVLALYLPVLCNTWKLLKKLILTCSFFLELEDWNSKDDS